VLFRSYLRAKGWPYVAVDESKKTILGRNSIKSFDFLVYSASGPNLLVDVKGRKFPDGVTGPRRGADKAYENWITQQDADGLREWEKVFGRDFMALLVFAYWLQGPPQRSPFEDVHLFRENHYAFVAIRLSDYLAASKLRSAKWQTMGMPAAELARQAGDIAGFL
jgi:hypothetical protein